MVFGFFSRAKKRRKEEEEKRERAYLQACAEREQGKQTKASVQRTLEAAVAKTRARIPHDQDWLTDPLHPLSPLNPINMASAQAQQSQMMSVRMPDVDSGPSPSRTCTQHLVIREWRL
jgi:hypothetical protein